MHQQPLPTVGADGIAVYNLGIDGDNSEGQLSVLEPDSGAVRWSQSVPNARLPIPTIAGETVYLADGDQLGRYGLPGGVDRPRRKIHALSLEDGSERWTHTYETDEIDEILGPNPPEQTVGSEARIFRPMVAGPEALYALYRSPGEDEETRIYVLDRTDGTIRGSFGPISEDAADRSFAVADGAVYTHRRRKVQTWR